MDTFALPTSLVAIAFLLAWLAHFGLQQWLGPEFTRERVMAERAFAAFLTAALAHALTWHYVTGRPWQPLIIGWSAVAFVILVFLGVWWLDGRR